VSNRTERGSRDDDGDVAMLLARCPHGDFNVLPEGGKKLHQAFDGVGTRLAAHQAGDVRLLDAENCSGLGLREPTLLDEPIDLQREPGLDLLALRVGEPEVSIVSGRFRFSTSDTRLLLPSTFSKSLRLSPRCCIRNLMASIGSGGFTRQCFSS
jgi:hypothetical protein